MFIVVSKWEMLPGQDEAFKSGAGRQMREWLRAQSEVEFVHEFRTEDGNACAVVAYTDEPSYRKLILEPNSQFERKAAEMGLDKMGRWLWSERGEVAPDRAGAMA